jgi:hypothetical protein
MKNPIEEFFRDHVELCRALLAEHEPRKGIGNLARHLRELEKHFGETGFARIHARSRALIRQLFGGDDAPALPRYQIDGYAAVEADLVAEKLVAEYRGAGVRPSKDPAWRDTLNTRHAALCDGYRKQLEQRAQPKAPAPAPSTDEREFVRALLEYEMAMAARWQSPVAADDVARLGAIAFPPGTEQARLAIEHVVRYAAAAALGLPLAPNPVRDLEVDRELTPETATAIRQYAESIAADIVKRQTKAPAPNPALPNLEATVAAAVARALDERHVQVREGPGGVLPPMVYRAVWQASEVYEPGDAVTHKGQLWHAGLHTTAMPGTDHSWQLMHKALVRETRPGKSEREAARGSL